VPEPSPPPPHQRFLYHSFCGAVIPPAFAAYYLWTYIYWLKPSSNPTADINADIPNGLYVWWSWFVIGAIGMNISNYTLAAVEAGMMMDRRFRPESVEQIVAHRDMPWSTLHSWVDVGAEIYHRLMPSNDQRKPPRLGPLWILLWGLSVLSWTFVLSGLTMQTYSGFKVGNTPAPSWQA
jgi:hypothetical protein